MYCKNKHHKTSISLYSITCTEYIIPCHKFYTSEHKRKAFPTCCYDTDALISYSKDICHIRNTNNNSNRQDNMLRLCNENNYWPL